MTGPVLAGLVEAYVQVRGEDEGDMLQVIWELLIV